jgi:hypothetical protein
MPIAVQCSGCGGKFRAPDGAAGKQVKCPKCSVIIEVGSSQQKRVAYPATAEERPMQMPPPIPAKPEALFQKTENSLEDIVQAQQGTKIKKGYLVVLAGVGIFAACYFLEILLGLERQSAGCFGIPAYFVMGVALIVGTVMVAREKGHGLWFGVAMGLISPWGLLIVTLIPKRAKTASYCSRSSEAEMMRFLADLEQKDG